MSTPRFGAVRVSCRCYNGPTPRPGGLMRIPAVLLAMIGFTSASGAAPQRATLEFQVNDSGGRALPCRIHLADSAGKPAQPPGLPFWKDHFVCDGRVAIELEAGAYTYQIERGPEYQ